MRLLSEDYIVALRNIAREGNLKKECELCKKQFSASEAHIKEGMIVCKDCADK